MPLFNKKSNEPINEPAHQQLEHKSSIFSKRSSISTSSSVNQPKPRNHLGSLFSRPKHPSIVAASEKVKIAEEAEHAADRALSDARDAVVHAREHVRRLEFEVDEEGRLAKLKQEEARGISKSAKGLGRHGPD